jgi:hypothetical protein
MASLISLPVDSAEVALIDSGEVQPAGSQITSKRPMKSLLLTLLTPAHPNETYTQNVPAGCQPSRKRSGRSLPHPEGAN